MDHITVRELKGATSGKLICGDDDGSFTGLCTDSRIFEDGDMFVALLPKIGRASCRERV